MIPKIVEKPLLVTKPPKRPGQRICQTKITWPGMIKTEIVTSKSGASKSRWPGLEALKFKQPGLLLNFMQGFETGFLGFPNSKSYRFWSKIEKPQKLEYFLEIPDISELAFL